MSSGHGPNKFFTPGLACETDWLLLFVLRSVFSRRRPKTSSGGTFSPRVRCSFAIFRLFSRSVKEEVFGKEGEMGDVREDERECDLLIGVAEDGTAAVCLGVLSTGNARSRKSKGCESARGPLALLLVADDTFIVWVEEVDEEREGGRLMKTYSDSVSGSTMACRFDSLLWTEGGSESRKRGVAPRRASSLRVERRRRERCSGLRWLLVGGRT